MCHCVTLGRGSGLQATIPNRRPCEPSGSPRLCATTPSPVLSLWSDKEPSGAKGQPEGGREGKAPLSGSGEPVPLLLWGLGEVKGSPGPEELGRYQHPSPEERGAPEEMDSEDERQAQGPKASSAKGQSHSDFFHIPRAGRLEEPNGPGGVPLFPDPGGSHFVSSPLFPSCKDFPPQPEG